MSPVPDTLQSGPFVDFFSGLCYSALCKQKRQNKLGGAKLVNQSRSDSEYPGDKADPLDGADRLVSLQNAVSVEDNLTWRRRRQTPLVVLR